MDNCASHNDSTQALLTTDRLNMEIKKLPVNTIDLCQPANSFVISKIKDAWTQHWEAHKLQCVQNGYWKDEVRIDGRASGVLKSPGKHFFMDLAEVAMKDEKSKATGWVRTQQNLSSSRHVHFFSYLKHTPLRWL